MLPLEASPYPTIAASVWRALSSLDYDHMQLQLLPQLWQATIASACDPDCANALDLSDVAVLGEIVALPPSSPVKPDRIIGSTSSGQKDCPRQPIAAPLQSVLSMVNIIVVLTSDQSKQTAEAANTCQSKHQPLCGEDLSQSLIGQSSSGSQPQAQIQPSTQSLFATTMQMVTQGEDKPSAAHYITSLRSALLVIKLISLTPATRMNSNGNGTVTGILWSTLVAIGQSMQQQHEQENGSSCVLQPQTLVQLLRFLLLQLQSYQLQVKLCHQVKSAAAPEHLGHLCVWPAIAWTAKQAGSAACGPDCPAAARRPAPRRWQELCLPASEGYELRVDRLGVWRDFV